jgi:hypothetical protein
VTATSSSPARLDLRMDRPEARQRGGHERGAGGQEGAHAHGPGLQARERAHLLLGGGHLAQQRGGVLVEPRSGLGQADRPLGSVDQREAELALERGHVVRDHRLGVAERQRRLREGAPLGDGVERAQAPQVVHR